MFLKSQPKQQFEKYKESLTALGALSRLFSESEEPYLYYRAHERVFCRCFSAKDRSRDDVSVDATKNGIGIGIKTFLNGSGRTLQKVAEFDADRPKYSGKPAREIISTITDLCNKRIEYAKRIYNLSELFFHCVTRRRREMLLFETPLVPIDPGSISHIKETKSGIQFRDRSAEYSFYLSKSTLLRRFETPSGAQTLPIEILEDPFTVIEKLIGKKPGVAEDSAEYGADKVLLPLYSYKNKKKTVFERSGLNQWNAKGRPRDPDEVYIPIPSWVHEERADFFPARDVKFDLRLPNSRILSAKICQDGEKALMSDPNKDLGRWILRDVLQIPHGEILTYSKLEEAGVDSVVISKISPLKYEMDFRPLNSFEEFSSKYLD